ncbi:MAG TPA: flagellar hook-length control protein FliK [Deltaproteobacteria bacterium]|nr:flagellar hook-length control protein FliK [Deltaproteobacteria bacterium]
MLIPSMTGQTPSAPNPAAAGGEATESSQANSEFETLLNGASDEGELSESEFEALLNGASDEGELSEEDFLLAALAPDAFFEDLRTSGLGNRKGFPAFQNTAALKSEVLEVHDPRIADFESVRPTPSIEEQLFAADASEEGMDLPEFESFLRTSQETRQLPEAESLKAKDVFAQAKALDDVPVEELKQPQIPTARQSLYANTGEPEQLEFSMRDLNQVLTRASEAHAVQSSPSSMAATLAAEAAAVRVESGAAVKEVPVLQTPQDLPFDVEQVVSRVRTMGNGETQEITLRMEPEHLGRVVMKVRQTGNELLVEMRVDNPAAKQLLEAGFDTLRSRFLDQEFAYQEMRMHVDIDQRSGSQHQAQQQAFHEELVGNIRPGESDSDSVVTPSRTQRHDGSLSILA